MRETPTSPEELAEIADRIERWAQTQLEENPVVDAVERDAEAWGRWFIRVRGEEKDVFTLWFTLRQRTLRYETHVMPAPEENHAALYEHLLRRNLGFYGVAFGIGDEDAIFLAGGIDVSAVTDDELDRILGTLYATVEQCFRPALRLGFASRFAG